ncbi:MAG: glycosyltransferase family 2 protein, partial [Spirochaetes bacterium]|nr:glycosyltransferase family 2 protein [Spirochaetota bacterium]
MKIALIIPVYNEELTIKDVILDFHKVMPIADIFIIDNNSTDNSNKIANNTLKKIKSKGEVIFVKRKGKANAVRHAFKRIDADIYIMVDGDFTYKAKDLPKLIKPIMDHETDMAVGDRLISGNYKKENKRQFHNFGNVLVKKIINFIFKTKLNDIMSGYRVFNKHFIKNFPILSEGFELETEMTLHAIDKKFNIVEIPIDYIDRPTGSTSKLNTLKDGIKVLKTIFIIFKDYKPFSFFGFLSFFFFITGMLIG